MGNIEKFNAIANQYDTPERIEIAQRIADRLRVTITDGKDKDAIDYGCGTGLVGMQLLRDFKSMLFIDASKHMVEQVKHKISQSPLRNASAICCDFETQCPAKLGADYVILVQTLLHIPKVELVLSSLYSVLRAGGHLLIVDFDKNDAIISEEVHNGFEQEKLIDAVKAIGFKYAEAQTFYHGKKIFMNRDASLFLLDAVK